MISEQELMVKTGHRFSSLPTSPYVCYQEWHDTLFLHFRVDAAMLVPMLPPTVKLETFHGEAWLSMVIFTLKNTSPRYFINYPVFRNFQEMNIRTYVRHRGQSGIYMFRVTTNHTLFAMLSKYLMGIPYEQASLSVKGSIYCASAPGIHLDAACLPGVELEDKSAFDEWITERYVLYELKKGSVYRYDIHHMPWQLKSVDWCKSHFFYKEGELQVTQHDLFAVHMAAPQAVVLWPPVKIDESLSK